MSQLTDIKMTGLYFIYSSYRWTAASMIAFLKKNYLECRASQSKSGNERVMIIHV